MKKGVLRWKRNVWFNGFRLLNFVFCSVVRQSVRFMRMINDVSIIGTMSAMGMIYLKRLRLHLTCRVENTGQEKKVCFIHAKQRRCTKKGDYIPTSEFDFFKGVVPTKEGEEFLGWRLQEVESKYIVTDYNCVLGDFHILKIRKPTLLILLLIGRNRDRVSVEDWFDRKKRLFAESRIKGN